MSNKEVIHVYLGNYYRNLGQTYIIITGRENTKENTIITEWFYLICKDEKMVFADALSLSCTKGAEFSSDIERFIEVITIPNLHRHFYRYEIFPKIEENPNLYDIYPKLELTEIDKSYLYQINRECPMFIEKTVELTENEELKFYLQKIKTMKNVITVKQLKY